MVDTLELTIDAKSRRYWTILTNWLESIQQAYVSGCVVEDEANEELEAWIASTAWQDLPSWPVSLYFPSEAALIQFVESFWTWIERYQAREFFEIQVQKIPSQIWQEAWEAEAQSFETAKFQVQVQGTDPVEAGKIEITIQPGKAFGSGQHATTKATILLLEKLPSGTSLLDVGTGTGILAIVAEKLGFRRIMATDIDSDAWLSAETNRKLNQANFELLRSSLPEGEELFDTIVCNILPPVLNQLLPSLAMRISGLDGRLVLAGIHEANVEPILVLAGELGLRLEAKHSERGWLAISLQQVKPKLLS